MEEFEKIELRSDEVQEILGTPPRWIVRWGTTVIFLGIILVGLASYLVKYPDVVEAPITITTEVEPVSIVSQKGGHLDRLLVTDGESVEYGDYLVVIRNPALFEHVLLLDSLTQIMQQTSAQDLIGLKDPGILQVGDLQEEYSRFTRLFRDLKNDLSSRFDLRKMGTLDGEIRSIQASIEALRGKLQKAQEQYLIADRQLKSAQSLYVKGLESKNAVERAGANRADIDKQVQSIRAEISEKEVMISQIKSQKINIGSDSEETRSKKSVELQEEINSLRSAIDSWKEENLLLAPIQGRVALNADFRSAQQFIQAGDRVMSIIPS
ncbi:MAG: hypothetical protein HKN16_12490, partial [Saprospiraceae bacterium]|nr:hypothetical protein [Saprospiraceae bacterium]